MNARDDELTIEAEAEWAGLRPGAADQAAAEAMQRRIVETAERLYRQYGYQKTTVADIAAELGMSPANVYRFFASKAAITEAVARKRHLRGRGADPRGDRRAGPQRLRAAAAADQGHARPPSSSAASTTTGCTRWCTSPSTRTGASSRPTRRTCAGSMAGIIADGVASGEFDVADVDVAAHCFQAAMISSCHPVIIEHRLRSGEDIEATLDPMLAFALRGLGAREAG